MSVHISSWAWKHSRAAGATLLVLLALADISDDDGHSYPGIPHLARKTRLSTRTVRRQLSSLEELGELRVDRNIGRPNVYEVITDQGQIGAPHEGAKQGQNDPGQSVTPDTSDHDRGQIEHSLLIPTRQDTSMVNGGSSDPVSDHFDEFWLAYPRKVKKADAMKAYRKAVKVATPEEILAGLAAYAKTVAGKEPEFIAHPPTWLNGKRWLDEHKTTTSTSTGYDRSKEFTRDDYS